MFYLLYGFYGGNDFSMKEALDGIKEKLGDREMVATNTTVFQGKDIALEQLISTCDTIPFLAPKRLVIVEGLLSLFEYTDRGKRPPRHKSSGWYSLAEYVGKMPESTVLVLMDSNIRKSNPLFKELLPAANEVKEFKPLQGPQLGNWIRNRVEGLGGSISAEAVKLLTGLIGSNLWVLSGEIEKLSLYTQGGRIERENVMALVEEARIFTVFDMVDTILEREGDAAIKLLHRLEEEGAAPPYLLTMITRQFRMVIQAKAMMLKKRRLNEIGNALAINNRWALNKTMEQAREHSIERLGTIYRRLLDTDISIKTGRLRGDKGELALDLLVSELCM